MLKRYRYRAYPTLEQVKHFNQTFGSTRFVYNNYVKTNKINNKLTSYKNACFELTVLKKKHGYEWLNNVSSIALQQSLKDAAAGSSLFFANLKKKGKRTVNPPKFKRRGTRQTYRIVGSNSYKVINLNNKWSGVILPKLTQPLKFKTERKLPNFPTSVTVIQESNGEYYVSFVIEVSLTPLPLTTQHAGGDVGLNNLLIVADNNGGIIKFNNPRYYRKAETALKRAQKELSRKKKGSRNRDKARLKVAKKHTLVANQRKDHYNKLSISLIRENQTISLENLKISNMTKNHKLAKSISDVSWGLLKTCLQNHAIQYGREIILIDQWYASTQICYDCKIKRTTKLSLAEREWVCDNCGVIHDRDINAALNILFEGQK